jgi:hypothetical protein
MLHRAGGHFPAPSPLGRRGANSLAPSLVVELFSGSGRSLGVGGTGSHLAQPGDDILLPRRGAGRQCRHARTLATRPPPTGRFPEALRGGRACPARLHARPCQPWRRAPPVAGQHASSRSQRHYRAECRSSHQGSRYPLLHRSGPSLGIRLPVSCSLIVAHHARCRGNKALASTETPGSSSSTRGSSWSSPSSS